MAKHTTTEKRTALKKLTKKGTKAPHLAELVEALFKEFGGAAQLASMYHAEFISAAKGSLSRQRLLEGMTRLVQSNTKLMPPENPSDDKFVTEDDLDREINELVAATTDAEKATEDTAGGVGPGAGGGDTESESSPVDLPADPADAADPASQADHPESPA